MYRLKPSVPDFEVVDGPFERRKYKAGELYTEIPPNEAHKFDVINPPPSSPSEGGQAYPPLAGAQGVEGKENK